MGSIGGLVHAAGAFDLTVLSKVDDDRWDQIVNVNLKAEMQLVRSLLSDLRANEGSAVVGISSIEAFVAQPAFHSYSRVEGRAARAHPLPRAGNGPLRDSGQRRLPRLR